ncbi:MAG: hypothetical protein ABFS46_10490 [Myxococcota bacterium]
MTADPPRLLGVIEAIQAVCDQCPSGAVRRVAEGALETVRREGAASLPTQAFLVLSAARGWTGERAAQVKRSLQAFLDGS